MEILSNLVPADWFRVVPGWRALPHRSSFHIDYRHESSNRSLLQVSVITFDIPVAGL